MIKDVQIKYREIIHRQTYRKRVYDRRCSYVWKRASRRAIKDNDREVQDKKEDIAEDAKETLENEVQDVKEDTKKAKKK